MSDPLPFPLHSTLKSPGKLCIVPSQRSPRCRATHAMAMANFGRRQQWARGCSGPLSKDPSPWGTGLPGTQLWHVNPQGFCTHVCTWMPWAHGPAKEVGPTVSTLQMGKHGLPQAQQLYFFSLREDHTISHSQTNFSVEDILILYHLYNTFQTSHKSPKTNDWNMYC